VQEWRGDHNRARYNRAVSSPRARVVLWLVAFALAACSRAPAPRADWVIEGKVEFRAADRITPRAAPPVLELRLWMPWVVGDVFGTPKEGEIGRVALDTDYRFQLDLNALQARLAQSLVPTEFSEKWMRIEPAEARAARLLPFVVESGGIQTFGDAEWLDPATGEQLMLLYVDRPARIVGEYDRADVKLAWQVQATEAGFFWVTVPRARGIFQNVGRVQRVTLVVLPKP
jgi:hypothetical protein